MKKLIYSLIGIFVLTFTTQVIAQTNSTLKLRPALDIGRFEPYTIEAEIDPKPSKAYVKITGINGDGGDVTNYFADGTPKPDEVLKPLSYNPVLGSWISESIYPDSIYPEIYFVPSSVTWNNKPDNEIVRKTNYQILHFQNPYRMVEDMNFFVEINAMPISEIASPDLQVYLVGNNENIKFFNSDWRNRSNVELIGTFGNNTQYNHVHSKDHSAHIVIPLTTDLEGKIGKNKLDINSDFWIILYTDAADNSKGWNLKHHHNSICKTDNRWFKGSTTSWSVLSQAGCPDAHIHIARRDQTIKDGFRAELLIDNGNGFEKTYSSNFYFDPLPDLPPTSTSFISPLVGGIYDGDFDNTILIEWDPASNPNHHNLVYSIDLIDPTGSSPDRNIVTNTALTHKLWDIETQPNGKYSLKGKVCSTQNKLCNEFILPGTFEINKTDPIYTLSNINITSSNQSSPKIANASDTVWVSFSANSNNLNNLTVNLFIGGKPIQKSPTLTNYNNSWVASYTISESDTTGYIDFVIIASNLDRSYSSTTDTSFVLVQPASHPICLDSFADITTTTSLAEYICSLKSQGIIGGYSDGLYHPDYPVTRGQFASLIIRSLDSDLFKETNSHPGHVFKDSISGPHEKDINILVSYEIITGYSDNTFRQDEKIKRGEAAKIIARLLELNNIKSANSAPEFKDVISENKFYSEINTISSQKIMTGNQDGFFMPEDNLKRDQVAKIIYILLGIITTN